MATQLAWMFACLASDIGGRHRQFDNQARPAADIGQGGGTVLGINPPASPLDNLPGDGKAETGIAPEILAWPLGVETVEDGFQIAGRNAGTFILHHYPHDEVAFAGGNDHLAVFRTEGN